MEFEEEELKYFEVLARELSSAISTAGYVNFDGNIPVPKSMNNDHEIDWSQKHKKLLKSHLKPK